MTLRIDNRSARRLWLHRQGLAATPTGTLDLLAIIRGLGFVQLDTIQVVSRAHHHILWSRNQNYREPMLNQLLKSERAVFEHFTHDASVLPMEFLPMWQRQFRRMREHLSSSSWYASMPDAAGLDAIRQRIEEEGPLSTHAFDSTLRGPKQMWQRPPHKLGLDFLWYAGVLATSHREGFTKFYDLGERVFASLDGCQMSDAEQLDWLCRAALERLGFATPGDIKRFWEAVDTAEVKSWVRGNAAELVEVEITCHDGTRRSALAPADIEATLAALGAPTARLRILNPFDPVIRDRNRLLQLFGFDYRVEMFVPAAKRKWGYYIYPLLEGDRFVGRLEVKGDRKNNKLNVLHVWREPKVRWTSARAQRLEAELARLARFAGLAKVQWQCSSQPALGPTA